MAEMSSSHSRLCATCHLTLRSIPSLAVSENEAFSRENWHDLALHKDRWVDILLSAQHGCYICCTLCKDEGDDFPFEASRQATKTGRTYYEGIVSRTNGFSLRVYVRLDGEETSVHSFDISPSVGPCLCCVIHSGWVWEPFMRRRPDSRQMQALLKMSLSNHGLLRLRKTVST